MKTKMKRLVMAAALLTFLPLSSALANEVEMQEGMWEISTTTQVVGIPVKVPLLAYRQCLNQDDLVPRGRQQPGQKCTLSNSDVKGNTVTWAMECIQDKITTTMTGTITYDQTTLSGTMTSETNNANGGVSTVTTMGGKYIGPCT